MENGQRPEGPGPQELFLPEPERRDIIDKLDRTIAESATHGITCALVIVSIEHMDVINTAFGFGTGDEILTEAATQLSLVIQSHDAIHRLSGTKFAIILRGCDSYQLYDACRKYRDAVRGHQFATDAGPVSMTVAVSAVLMPACASNGREAVEHALSALVEARQDRLRAIAIYRRDLQRERQRMEDARVAHNVVAAIAKGQMQLSYQPIVHADTGRIAFHEALIRIVDSDGELREAGKFIAAAERLGLIRMVDHRALDLAVHQLKTFPNAVLSVNVSHESFSDTAWLDKLANACAACPGLAQRLIIEITESQVATNLEETRRLVEAVRAHGCRVAIDDFGAGFTSFRNLKQMPVDIIKIDGSFAKDLANNSRNQVFIMALIAIARALKAETVAEWVADAETAAMLREWGVDYLQGFALGIPVAAAHWPAKERASELAAPGRDAQALEAAKAAVSI